MYIFDCIYYFLFLITSSEKGGFLASWDLLIFIIQWEFMEFSTICEIGFSSPIFFSFKLRKLIGLVWTESDLCLL